MPFYNTSSPTPTTFNTINSVSSNIRDFLLNNNLLPTYPQISTAINGSPRIGDPVLDTESNHLNFFPHQQMTQDTSTLDILGSVLNGQGVGIGAGGSAVPNFDVRGSLAGRVLGATGLLNDTKIGTIGAQQLALALANNAAFNVQQDLLGSLNVQDNVLALVKGAPLPGFRPSYQITIPSSSSGKALDFAGKMLGFTIPRSYLGPEGSIFQSENGDAENIDRANEMLKNTGKGQALALIANAKENLSVNSSTTPFRSGYAPSFTNNKGDYSNNSIDSTQAKLYAYDNGKGQFVHLLSSNEGSGVIPNLNYNKEEKNIKSGFLGPEDMFSVGHTINLGYYERQISDVGFSWGSTNNDTVNLDGTGNYQPIDGDKKSLLVKTQKLFNSKGMLNIVSVKGDMNKTSTQISQSNGGGFSKGNAVLQRHLFDAKGNLNGSSNKAEETYCRSWTTIDRYDKIKKLVRSGTDSIENGGEEINGIYKKNVPYRDTDGGTEGTILDKYGFPQIAPYTTDTNNRTDPKKFMFSIENLAWADRVADLPPYEVGPGDIINNKKGRIMWFPPYDISFTENSSVNWESTNFIGRGEPLYTYNNTERSGTLTFKVVVDHPSYINSFRGASGPDDHYVNSFWAGCITPEFGDKLTVSESDKMKTDQIAQPQKINVVEEAKPDVKLVVYFPNDQAVIPPSGYESGISGSTPTSYIDYSINKDGSGYGIKLYPNSPEGYTPGLHEDKGWYDNTNYGLNGYSEEYSTPIEFENEVYWGWRDRAILLNKINTYLTQKCPHCRVNVTGFASQQGIGTSNTKLVDDRADSVIAELKNYLFLGLSNEEKTARFKKITGSIPTTVGCKPGVQSDIDQLPCKKDRRAEITFEFDREFAEKELKKPDIIKNENKKISTKITDRFYNETKYFDQLTDEDPLVFDSFRNKIKYFHPAFHSTTPEGLNSRLTFLLQCTRQGPTTEDQGPNNLAFGRPPVCVLRIGDFYNTKIIMDSIGIDYEPLVWDLNPEGIGVQPMIANINISFKFIGGSSLMGPINKLQNALSFNYFANTQVYDVRADYISKDRPTWNLKDKDGKDLPMSAIAPISKSGYYVNNGMSSIPDPEILTRTEIISITDIPEQDQVATQNNAAGGAQETSSTVPTGTVDDKAVINLISLVGFKTYYFDNSGLELVFSWTSSPTINKLNMNDVLAKTYKGQVYVIDSTNITTNLGYVSIRSNGANNGVVFAAGTGDENILGPDITSKIEWSTYLVLDDTQNAIVAAAIKKSGSNINIIWETGPKNNRGFAESLGL